MSSIIQWIHQLFCRHEWKVDRGPTFFKLTTSGKPGGATFIARTCIKCEKCVESWEEKV